MFPYRDKNGFTPLEKKIVNFNPIKRHNSLTGFTIIEAVVSALIIAVLAAGVFGAFYGAQYLLNRARHRIQAYNFAVEAIDRLKSNYKYTESQMTLTTAASDADDHLESEIGAILRGEITNLGATLKYDVIDTGVAASGYKQVTIKVHWDEPR